MAQDTRGRLAVWARATSGFRSRCVRSRSATTSSGYDVDDPRASGSSAGESYVEDITDDDSPPALATGRYRPTSDAPRLRRVRRRRDHRCRRRCATAHPDLSYIEDRGAYRSPRYLRPGAHA